MALPAASVAGFYQRFCSVVKSKDAGHNRRIQRSPDDIISLHPKCARQLSVQEQARRHAQHETDRGISQVRSFSGE